MNSIQLNGIFPTWFLLILAIASAVLAWWLYYRESRALAGFDSWLLPTLRSLAILFSLLLLLQPSCHRRWQEGETAELRIILDQSLSMSVSDNIPADSSDSQQTNSNSPPTSRLQSVDQILLSGTDPLLSQWSESHDLSVQTLLDQDLQTVWQASDQQNESLPISVMDWQNSWGNSTGLGYAFPSIEKSSNGEDTDRSEESNGSTETDSNATDSVLLFFTDGQNNAGSDALKLAKEFAQRSGKIYAVGMGPKREDRDLAIANVTAPKSIYFTDQLSGTIQLHDQMQLDALQGKSVSVQIQRTTESSSSTESEPLWQQTFEIDGSGKKDIRFSFPVREMIQQLKADWRDVEYATLPMQFEASVTIVSGERTDKNNRFPFRVAIGTRRQRVLLIDGRSRWESRYLRNSLERDPNWHVDSFLVDQSGTRSFSQGQSEATLPDDLQQLLQYDLIVLGQVQPDLLPANFQAWVQQFVAATGGGLIVVDGQRNYWSDNQWQNIKPMLPVSISPNGIDSPTPMKIQVTPTGQTLGVMQIADDSSNNFRDAVSLWQTLPGMRWVAATEVLPGSETLATLQHPDGQNHPYLATRLYGAGRVLYVGSDQSWRWRYGVEDQYHQRFWNQAARWVMRSPFMVQSEWVSLDTAGVFNQPNEPIQLRARLMATDGSPAQLDSIEGWIALEPTNETASLPENPSDAVQLNRQRKTMQKVQLVPVPDYPGVYQGQIAISEPGNYQFGISAPGYQQSMLDYQANFSITGEIVNEYADLTCDEAWLKQLCETSGGTYVHQSDAASLAELISATSQGKYVEQDILLWQSYYWFTPIVILLSLEWWRRKQVGLI